MILCERPLMYPYKCARCGSVRDDRKYVDLQVDLETYSPDGLQLAVVYLCTHCAREAFTVAFPDGDGLPVAELESKLADALQTIELQKELLRLRSEQISKLEEAYGVLVPSSNSLGVTDSEPVADSEPTTSEVPKERSGSTTRGKKGTTKSTTGTGPENVPSLAVLLKPKSSSVPS